MPVLSRHGYVTAALAGGLAFLLVLAMPGSVRSGELEDGLLRIVQDFQRHIGQVPPGQKYTVVVRFFETEENHKPAWICERIESILVNHLVERFSDKKEIEVLDRRRVQAMDAEIAFTADPSHSGASSGDWVRKFGQKKGAGFLITGTTARMTRDLEITANMIDVVSGSVVASSHVKVPLDSIDPMLFRDYPSSGYPASASSTPPPRVAPPTYAPPTTPPPTTPPPTYAPPTYAPPTYAPQPRQSSGGDSYSGSQDIYARMNQAQLMALLREAGYSPEVVRDNVIRVQMDGLKVIFFVAENQLNLQAYAGFSGGGVSLKTINDWNKDHRFSHAYLDNENDPAVELDLDLEGGGVTKDNVMNFFSLVRLSVTTFKTKIWGE